MKPRARTASCEHGFSDFIHEHLHKITVMLEALQIMLAGEYWLSKAMRQCKRSFAQTSSNE